MSDAAFDARCAARVCARLAHMFFGLDALTEEDFLCDDKRRGKLTPTMDCGLFFRYVVDLGKSVISPTVWVPDRFKAVGAAVEAVCGSGPLRSSSCVLLTGRAGSGKSTVASRLVATYGFREVALAGPLKEFVFNLCNEFFKFVTLDHFHDPHLKNEPLDDALTFAGGPSTPRRILQLVGTEVFRELVGEHVWVMVAVERVLRMSRVVISDVRFENEAKDLRHMLACRGYHVKLIRIVRPSLLRSGVHEHASERDIDSLDVDAEVINDGTVEDLVECVRWVTRRHEDGPAGSQI